MLDSLHALPNAGVFLLICGVLVGLAALGPFLGARAGLPQEAGRAGAVEAFKAIAAAAVIVLAFSLSQVQATLRLTQDAVVKEAATLAELDRLMLRADDPGLAAARGLLREYGTAVVGEEWPLIARGGRSAEATRSAGALSQAVRRFEPEGARQAALFAAMLRQLDDMDEMRESRIAAGETGLPGLFYGVATGLCLLLAAVALLVPPSGGNPLHLAGMAGTVALLLSLVVVLDRPFSGETQVTAEPMVRMLARNAERR